MPKQPIFPALSIGVLLVVLAGCNRQVADPALAPVATTPLARLVPSDRFDFKGVPLGSSQGVLLEKFPMLECDATPGNVMGDSVCRGEFLKRCKHLLGNGEAYLVCQRQLLDQFRIGGKPAYSIDGRFYSGSLASLMIEVSEKVLDDVVAAIEEKYGKPNEKNSSGMIWKRSDSHLLVSYRGTEPGRASIVFALDSSVDEMERRKATHAKFGAKDL